MATIDDAMNKLAEIEAKVDILNTKASNLISKINNIIDSAKKILNQMAKTG